MSGGHLNVGGTLLHIGGTILGIGKDTFIPGVIRNLYKLTGVLLRFLRE